jgi:hypothetical protein
MLLYLRAYSAHVIYQTCARDDLRVVDSRVVGAPGIEVGALGAAQGFTRELNRVVILQEKGWSSIFKLGWSHVVLQDLSGHY